MTTNLKSINNQKCQKIKLHGTPTTQKLKEAVNQTNQTSKTVDGENPWQGGGLCGQG